MEGVFLMLFADASRYSYANSPLIEVICQLRFPTILSIGASEPAQFQEAIRADFPRYVARQEQQPARMVNGKVEQVPPVTNYNFISADGLWKVNLTKDFIALSTLRYPRWEEFAQKLDKVLATFIQLYHPAFFQRLGLRYVNAFSRKRLGLEGELWDDLIESPFIGVLSEPDVDETAVTKNSLDVETTLAQGCRMKLHAGPGLLGGGKQDPEPKFILDGDFSISGRDIPFGEIAEDLNTLHTYAVRLFNAATTQELKEAMGQTPME